MRKVALWWLVLFMGGLFFSGAALADIKAEASLVGGYSGNLFNDSNATEDSYTQARTLVKIYPASFIEISVQNEYIYYSKSYGLSNFFGEISATVAPTPKNFPVTVYLNGRFNSRAYRDEFTGLNNDGYSLSLGLGYNLAECLRLRTGLKYDKTAYSNDDAEGVDELPYLTSFYIPSDNDSYELFGGVNLGLFGGTAIDIEVAYANKSLSYVEPPTDSITLPPDFIPQVRDYLNPNIDTNLIDGDLKSFYISPRISQSLGRRLGVNLTYTYRNFKEVQKKVVATTEFLSPWASIYDGESITFNIKTYYLPGFISSAGVGYWKKTFLKGEYARNMPMQPPTIIKERSDKLKKFYIGLRRPIRISHDSRLEPSLFVSYSENSSDIDLLSLIHI